MERSDGENERYKRGKCSPKKYTTVFYGLKQRRVKKFKPCLEKKST